MKIAILIISFATIWSSLSAQVNTNKIIGIVYQKVTETYKKPVPKGTSVFIPGIASTTTDDKGYYSLDLVYCQNCKTGEIIKIYVNSDIGYAEKELTIPNNPNLKPFDIDLIENKKLSLNGIVKDKKNGKLLPNIKVAVIIQNNESKIQPTITDDQGTFQIIIRREGILNMQAIQIIFSDAGNGKYKDLEKVVFINQYEPIKVEMEECGDECATKYNIKVNSFFESKIRFEKGDEVVIKAGGVIRVGAWVGNSGPEGIKSGVLGMSLEGYSYFKNWNHAVLVYRFGETDEWKYYDPHRENRYSVQSSGYIQFDINDKQQSDNEGAYEVEVLIKK